MDFTVARDKLSNALQKVSSIITSRSTLQVLGNVLMEVTENKLVFTTTDLDIRIKTEMECDVRTQGRTTIPAKKFQEIVRNLPQESVKVVGDEGNHISIECGNSKFKLNGLPADDFPVPLEMSPIRRFTLNQNDLSRMLKLINYAVTQDDTRKALNGILLSVSENNFITVATDGRRLALVEKVLEDFSGNDGEAILPIKSAHELMRLLNKDGKVVVEIGEKMASFSMDASTVMNTKLIEENYPNYKQVIPVSFSRKIVIQRESLTRALERVRLVVSERGYFIKLKFFSNALELSANSQEIGESSDLMQIVYDGPETSISFNPDFLLEPLKQIDADNVAMKMNDGYNPVALTTDDGFLYVIMPMRNR